GAHDALGQTLFQMGDYTAARMHFEQEVALTDLTVERTLALRQGEAPGVRCLAVAANALWCLGYPAQAVRRGQEALALARELEHPYSLAFAQHWAAYLHYRRREAPAVQAQADTLLTLATVQGFPLYVGVGTCWCGWVLAMQGQGEAGLEQLRQGLVAVVATGQILAQALCLVLLAEAAEHIGHVAEGLGLLAEALTAGEAICSRRRIGSRANCCYARPSRTRPKPKPASSRPSPLPAASRPNPGSCAPP